MKLNPIAVIVLLCGLLSVAMGIYAYRRRNTLGALPFALIMFSFGVYSVGYCLELTSPALPLMLFWNKVQYIGIVIFPTAYLVFAIQYTGYGQWLTRRRLMLLFLLPALFLSAKMLDDLLRLVYLSAEIDHSGWIPMLNFQRGPLYPIIVTYQLLVVTVGNVLLIERMRYGSDLYRKQTRLLLISCGIVYITFGIYLSGWVIIPGLKYIDWNPLAYTLWGSAMGLAIFRYRLFDLAPNARDALIEILHDGVIVVDAQLRIIDANPESLRIFGWPKPPLGKFTSEVLDPIIGELNLTSTDGPSVSEISLRLDSQEKFYEVTCSVLRDKTSTPIGKLLVLHDISERKETERKLEELSLVDELTGLTNRRGFKLLATQLISMANRMQLNATLFFIDVDKLKMINDQYGHIEGDRALVQIAKILKATYRSADIIARISGDEFVILALDSTEVTRDAMMDRLLERETLQIHLSHPYRLSFSVGYSKYEWEHPRSLESLFQEADQSMYERKKEAKTLSL